MMLRAMRALLYKLLCISVICKFFTRLKRVLGVRSSPSSDDILPTSGGGDLLKDDDDDVDVSIGTYLLYLKWRKYSKANVVYLTLMCLVSIDIQFCVPIVSQN